MIKSFLTNYLIIPGSIAKEMRHYYLILKVTFPLALSVHAIFIPLFYYIGASSLATFNILSVSSFIIVIRLNNRGFHLTAAIIAMAEVIGHSAFAIHTFGWQFGFQYYLTVLVVANFIYPKEKMALTTMLFLVILGSFLGMYYYSIGHQPTWQGNELFLTFFNVVNVAVSFFSLGIGVYFFRKNAQVAEAKLALEHERSEALLLNILPAGIAEQLKNNSKTIADGFEHATVLFADIVGFTKLSEQVSASELVAILNNIFSRFDDLVGKHNLEKIKTIGDAYMVASGIPAKRDDHAIAVLKFAQEMLKELSAFNISSGHSLAIRIGINSGPVVAGVIGKKKFIYDLWGDSVNTAARMESHGIVGKIHVTQTTYELSKEHFKFEDRGKIEVKGKGLLQTYLVIE